VSAEPYSAEELAERKAAGWSGHPQRLLATIEAKDEALRTGRGPGVRLPLGRRVAPSWFLAAWVAGGRSLLPVAFAVRLGTDRKEG
jgi:hypothetical protein